MKGIFDLTLLLTNVYLSHCCIQENQISFCQTLPADVEPGVLTLVLALKDVGQINSTVLHDDNLSSVTKLTVRDAGVTGVAEGAFGSFQNLTSLVLDLNLLTRINPQWLGNPTLLSELSLAGNRIEVVSESSLSGLQGLRKLSLNKNQIRNIDPDSFTDLSRLDELDLSENRLTRITPRVFRSLRSTRVRLDGNPWDCSCAADEFIAFLKDSRSRSLLLRDMEVTCESPPDLEGQTAWNVSACEASPSSGPPSETQTSIQPKPTVTTPPSSRPPSEANTPVDIPLTAVTAHPSSPPPSETKTPKPTDILTTTGTVNSTSEASRPPTRRNIIPTLIGVIVVLCVLLLVVCFLAVLYRRKRNGKTVMPSPEKEENAEVKDAHAHSEKTDISENMRWGAERRSSAGVRAKSANAILSTSPFCVSGKDQMTVQTEVEASSENRKETDEGEQKVGDETETTRGIHTENQRSTTGKIRNNPDENTHYCAALNSENVPYLSIGTHQNKPNNNNLNKQPADGPGRRSHVGKVMQRISTWPPTAGQWQERCQIKGEEETRGVNAFTVWMQNESLKFPDEVKNVEHPSGAYQGEQEAQSEEHQVEENAQTQDGLKMNDHMKSNRSQLSEPNDRCEGFLSDHVTSLSSVSESHNETGLSKNHRLNQEELQSQDVKRAENPAKKTNSKSSSNEAEVRSEAKAAGSGRRRAEGRGTGSKAPSGGGSPDDETLLYGNEYAFMDLLHEVVQNNGRWTRERWRQIHVNKQQHKH